MQCFRRLQRDGWRFRHHRCYIKDLRFCCRLCDREDDWWQLLLLGAEGHIYCKAHQKRWWSLGLQERNEPEPHEQRPGLWVERDLDLSGLAQSGSVRRPPKEDLPWLGLDFSQHRALRKPWAKHVRALVKA